MTYGFGDLPRFFDLLELLFFGIFCFLPGFFGLFLVLLLISLSFRLTHSGSTQSDLLQGTSCLDKVRMIGMQRQFGELTKTVMRKKVYDHEWMTY